MDLIGKGSSPEKAYFRKIGRIQVASGAENQERSSYMKISISKRNIFEAAKAENI